MNLDLIMKIVHVEKGSGVYRLFDILKTQIGDNPNFEQTTYTRNSPLLGKIPCVCYQYERIDSNGMRVNYRFGGPVDRKLNFSLGVMWETGESLTILCDDCYYLLDGLLPIHEYVDFTVHSRRNVDGNLKDINYFPVNKDGNMKVHFEDVEQSIIEKELYVTIEDVLSAIAKEDWDKLVICDFSDCKKKELKQT